MTMGTTTEVMATAENGGGSTTNGGGKGTAALVFGASGEQGRAVVEGMIDNAFSPVYCFTRNAHDTYLTDAFGGIIWTGDISNPDHVRRALAETKARAIFLVTTTELPTDPGQTSGYSDAAEEEFQVIALFFRILKETYEKDGIVRHVVFSVRENVQKVTREALLETTGEDDLWIDPLDDGSIVPHYSAKGKGGEYAMNLLQDIPGLRLTLLTIPFLFSNFLGFFAPLPNEGRTQWTLSACLGDGGNKIDMMSTSDLSAIVPNVFSNPEKYDGKTLRLVGEQISMDEVAVAFSDLFGKDVVYNPLTAAEVAILPFASAPAMAQMCQFLGDPRAPRHDLEMTRAVIFPKKTKTFDDWLLTHSDSTAFQRVGLDLDAPEILSVTVFGATSPQGTSVVKGLLKDERKRYTIRATSRHVDSELAKAVEALDPNRVELVFADFDDIESCRRAAEGVDGAFLVTDFYEEAGRDMEKEEKHARNVIDACEASRTVKHLVFSTMESVEEMNRILDLGLTKVLDAKGKQGTVPQFDAKALAAAYARTKKLSVTYVMMPCYSEMFFDMIERRVDSEGNEKLTLSVPLKDDTKVMCMSVDDLGPAVANIFDSYQVYAGHEIGLVTDFVSMEEVRDIIQEVFLENSQRSLEIHKEDVKTTEGESLAARDTYMKDLGQIFAYMGHTEAVKSRRSVAQTMKLVPSARPLRLWVEQNVDNAAFREKLGLR